MRGGRIGFDSVKTCIEGDVYYSRMQKDWWGIEYAGTIFRNPKGRLEEMNEYLAVMDMGIRPFSVVR